MRVLGLTGSIGMGKSTTAQIFREEGVPVWDADAAVHRLYAPGGAAVEAVGQLCPDAIRDGFVDREILKAWIRSDGDALSQLESVVHPLVARDRHEFLVQHEDAALVVLDIPLLFETGSADEVDAVLVVTIDAETQRDRVMSRPGMTPEQFQSILARQMPDAEKRARADFVIETASLDQTRRDVKTLIATLRKGVD